jgi:hypothetical protein
MISMLIHTAMTKRTGIIRSEGYFDSNQTGHNGGELHVDAGLMEESNRRTRMRVEDGGISYR